MNPLNFRCLFSVAALCTATLLSSSAPASADAFDPPAMIQVGGGAAFLGGNTVDALFRVNLAMGNATGRNSYFIWAKLSGDATVGANGVSYIDMQFDTLRWQHGMGDNFYGVSAVSVDVQRNIQIDNATTVRVTLLGVRGSIGGTVAPNVEMYLNGAADLIGLSYTQRHSDGASTLGDGTGLHGELGTILFKKIRIAIGERLGYTLGAPETVTTGRTCHTYYDEYGYPYYDCHDNTATRWHDRRITSNTYMSLVIDLTKNIQAFAQANYNVYVVNDDTGTTEESANGAFQFFLGVNGRF